MTQEMEKLSATLEAVRRRPDLLGAERDIRLDPFVEEALGLAGSLSSSVPVVIVDCAPDSPLGDRFTELGSDKNTRHSYGWLHKAILAPFEAPTILEVGVGSLGPFPYARLPPGRSLLAWKAWWPNAIVVGADIDPEALEACPAPAFWVDQTFEAAINELRHNVVALGAPLLICDDGYHEPHANPRTLIGLLPCMHPEGAYVIEDVHDSLVQLWQALLSALPLEAGMRAGVLQMS